MRILARASIDAFMQAKASHLAISINNLSSMS
jgi:hypothetical protein